MIRDRRRQLAHAPPGALDTDPEALPVVARMLVEIRSDGLSTIARGAIEDASTGDRVAVEARGRTPVALATSLARTIFSAPSLARLAVRALIPGRTRSPR